MKIIAFILSMYILVLNVVPCHAHSTHHHDSETVISKAMDDRQQHQDSGLCAPFCHCDSCAVYVTFFKAVDFTINTSTISTQVFNSVDGLEKDFYTTILQPPQA